MALILCIETATEVCSAALFDDGLLVHEKSIAEGNMHASHLHLLIQDIMLVAGIKPNAIKAVAVSKGPGSYTGLRVGVATAKGLCYALNIPLIAINTLQSLTYGFMQSNKVIPNQLFIPMLDAKRMEVYTAVFNNQLITVEPTKAEVIDENSFEKYTDRTVAFFGNGALKCKSILQKNFNGSLFLDFACNAKFMGSMAQQAYHKKEFESLSHFEPFYLKDFIATTPKNIFNKNK